MRYLLFLALVALVAATSYLGPETAFRSDHAYKFKYEGQVLTGTEGGTYLSGLKLEAVVNFEMKSFHKVHMQLEEVKFFKMLDEKAEKLPDEIIPNEEFVEVTDAGTDLIKEELYKPIIFKYHLGQITELKVEADEPFFSVNIKRGILHVIAVKFAGTEDVQDLHPEIVESYLDNDVTAPDHDAPIKTFKVMEEGIEGTCETIYTIIKTPDMPHGVKKIKKVKDMTKCEKKPVIMLGIATALNAEKFNKEIPEDGPLDMITEAEILLKGDEFGFLITEAEHKAKYIVTPIKPEMGIIVSHVVQKLVLMAVEDPFPIPVPVSEVVKPVFEMEIPVPIMSADPFSLHVSPEVIQLKKVKLLELLTEIDAETKPLTLEVPEKVNEAIKIIKKLPKEAIKTLIPTLEPKQKDILLVLLPADDTPKFAVLLKELLLEEVISEGKAYFLLTRHALVAPPSPEIIDTLLPLCKTEFECSKHFKTAVLLTVGVITNKIYKLKEMLPPTIIEPTLDSVVVELRTMFTKAKFEDALDDKKMIIKAIGNAGLPKFLPELEEIIKDKLEEPVIRKLAIYALKNLTNIAKSKIQDILLPVFLATTEPKEIRTAALVVLTSTEPSYAMLSIIADHLMEEPDKEFAFFVYSYLTALAKAEETTMKKIGLKAKKALFLVKPLIPKFKLSHAIVIDTIDETKTLGIIQDYAVLKYKDEDFLPNDFFQKIDQIMFNKKIELFESLVEVEGWTVMKDMFFGAEGMIKQILSGRLTIADAIRSIIEFIKAEAIEGTEPTIKVGTYMKLLANEIWHIDIEKEDIKHVIKKIELALPTLIPELIAGKQLDFFEGWFVSESAVMLPTPLGMPLAINFTMTTMMSAFGLLKVEEPQALFLPPETPELKAKIILDLQPSMIMAGHFHVGVEMPKLQAGHVIKAKTLFKPPIDLKIEVDPMKLTTKTTFEVPTQELEILVAEIEPMAFMIKLPLLDNDVFEKDEMEDKILPKFAIPETIHFEEDEFFGLGARFEVMMMKPLIEKAPTLPLIGKHSMKVILKPGTSAPAKMMLMAALLCPTCPLTPEEKHTFLFHDTEVESERTWWFSPARSSLRTADFHFDEIVACDWVNPLKKYQLAMALKTVEADEEKVAAMQISVLLKDALTAAQVEVQAIVPPLMTDEMMKIKLDTQMKIPEIFAGEELLHKTVVSFGTLASVVKKGEIQTKMFYPEHVADFFTTPFKFESKLLLTTEIPEMVKEEILKVLDIIQDLPIESNILKVKDLFLVEAPEEFKIVTIIDPLEIKAKIMVVVPEKVTELDVCPYFIPFPFIPASPLEITPIDIVPEPEEDPSMCIRKLITKRVRGINDLGEEEVCFSKVSVPDCKGPCRRPDVFLEREISFHCLPRYTPSTQRLVMESLDSVLEDMEDKTTDLQQIIELPQLCIAL